MVNILKSLKTKSAIDRINEEVLYELVIKEIKSGKKRDNFPHKFNSWVECVNPNLWKGFLSPFKYLKIGNDMPVDHIAKFENLDIEWAYICGRLGIPNQPLPRRNQTGYNDEYRSHYNQKSIEYVYSKLSEEINFFHYEF